MAFPTLAEIQSNSAVKPEAESAPATEASAPTPETPNLEAVGESGTDQPQEDASAGTEQDAQPTETRDAAQSSEEGESNRIPYNRFKEKVDQVNTLKETNELLKKQLESLQSKPEVETQPEPEEPDAILEQLNSLDEYESDSDMVKVMKDMAEELKTLRAKASRSEQGVQEIRVQEQVQKIEAEISSVTKDLDVYDKAGARVFILQTLSKQPEQSVKSLADQFSQWEKSQEDIILKRLGMKRPEARKEAKEAEPDVPPRPATAGAKTGSPVTSQKKPGTLKDLRKTLVSGRRR